MKRNYTKQFLLALFFGVSTSYAQVSIGDQLVPDTRAILDLSNGNNLGLLLPRTASNPNLAFSTDTSGLLFYYNENLFLKGEGTSFNAITPWKSIYTGTDQTDVYFNPAGFTPYAPPGTPSVGGVGIGLSSGVQGNLHIALKNKDVTLSGTSAPLLIGESDAVTHLSIDNDEILVKTDANTAGTLKLQEEGGSLTIGSDAVNTSDALTSHLNTTIGSTSNPKNLNVFGKVQESGFALVPQGVIVMWTGATAPSGWALCNGQAITFLNGTPGTAPDLRERFIVGAGPGDNTTVTGGVYPLEDTGGLNTVTLEETQIPSHTHTIDPGGAHVHTIQNMDTDGLDHDASGGNGQQYWRSNNGSDFDFSGGGDHTHTISNTGGGGDHENRPPYYALAFIMKL